MRKRMIGLMAVVTMAAAACGSGAVPGTSTGPAAGAGTTSSAAEGSVAAVPDDAGTAAAEDLPYPLPDTGQTTCYDETGVIACPGEGEPFYGQDGTYDGARPQYVDNGDGTVTDLVTGLMWQQDPGDKMTYAEAAAGAGSFTLAGYDDWRLPTIKELYSLIDFGGTDPSACRTDDGCGAVPFIDDEAFAFSYGDPSTERLIDSQWATATIYDGTTMGGNTTMFGVNFADGRIKGYPIEELHGEAKGFFVIYVRGGDGYGENDFADNGDGTVSDLATGLMWQQGDSGAGMEWAEALEYCEALDTAGYDDWRLPDAKELQSIVDYGRGPQSTGTAAIDPVFEATPITDEGGGTDWGFYWTGTTHASTSSGASAVYVAFGEALGWMQVGGDTVLQDVHGAGAQRSDPKTGDASEYPFGHGPQGDVIRIDNMVRCVRGGDAAATSGTTADVAQASGEAGPAAAGTGAPAGGPLAGAAAALGVAEDALVAALGDPGRGTPDFEDAALRLGVTVEELMAVLPPPPAP